MSFTVDTKAEAALWYRKMDVTVLGCTSIATYPATLRIPQASCLPTSQARQQLVYLVSHLFSDHKAPIR